ncbi:NAD(P)H-binding protein [Vibrio hannami]|uniref:NAD(P)-dependent oxidoreductase n=1 Tax=Vibrio hannami TaxID=2717094 RepID=UPI002410763F|nr:NAD(P)H-binding protein [Vibrio hannami]MDG3085070.1 NAD(P)H-binding protein [Vibrio hannami]
MKILLIGASGMIGSRILDEATSRKHNVIAVARNTDKIKNNDQVDCVKADVYDIPSVIELATHADVIVSALSPRNTDDAVKEAEAFTQLLIDIQIKAGKRLLTVGGGSSLQMPDGTSALELTPASILPEATGMRRAYAQMLSADIDFTVLAPGGMIAPGERTGSFRLAGRTMLANKDGSKSNISAEDFAVAMLDEIEQPKHFRTIFNVAY